MKVKLLSITDSNTAIVNRSQNLILETAKDFFPEAEGFVTCRKKREILEALSEAISEAEVIFICAEMSMYIPYKQFIMKALNFESEVNGEIREKIRRSGSDMDESLAEAHSRVPKNAHAFPSRDGMFSGFAVRGGEQHLVFLPLELSRIGHIVDYGVYDYLMSITGKKFPKEIDRELLGKLAGKIEEKKLTVSFADTQTAVFIKKCIGTYTALRENVSFVDEMDSDISGLSLKDSAAKISDMTRIKGKSSLGAMISRVYAPQDCNDERLFLFVAVSDSKNARVKKLYSQPGETPVQLVAAATQAIFEMLSEYGEQIAVDAVASVLDVQDNDTYGKDDYSDVYSQDDFSDTDEETDGKKGVPVAVKILIIVAIAVFLFTVGYIGVKLVKVYAAGNETPQSSSQENNQEEYEAFWEDTGAEDSKINVNSEGSEGFANFINSAASNIIDALKEIDADTLAFIKDTAEEMPEINNVDIVLVPETENASKENETSMLENALSGTSENTSADKGTTKEKETSAVKVTTTKEKTTNKTTTSTTKTTTTKATTKVTTTKNTTAKVPQNTVKPETTTKNNLSNTVFTFTAYGYGHGVGLSQMGAIKYAKNGSSYTSILAHYFPGSKIQTSAVVPATVTYKGKMYSMLDYLASSAGDEIGPSAPVEAIKAQVVAIYTRALNGKQETCECKGKYEYSDAYPNLKKAIDDVLGQYLSYNGNYLDSVFGHSTSGITASSYSAWGGKTPSYLEGGTSSPEEIEVDTYKISAEDFKEKFERAYPSMNFSDNPKEWIKIIERDPDTNSYGVSYISKIKVGGVTLKGNEFRAVLGYGELKSHCFTFTVK